MSVSATTFFNRIAAAQTEPVRRDIRLDREVLRMVNHSGFTPLEHAIFSMANKRGSSVEMVNLLLDEGADPNFRGVAEGPTALHHAVGANELSADVQHRIITMLLRHGADVTLTDYSNQTPAQMQGLTPDVLQLLGQADSLRRSFIAHGGVVATDRPTTPPVVAPLSTAAENPVQRVVGGAVGAMGAVVQQTVSGIMSGLGGAPKSTGRVVAAVPDAELERLFSHKTGALAMGNDVLVCECTVQEAFRKCLSLENAVGFTFAPGSAIAGGRYRCYFKSSDKRNRDPLWQSYMQTQPLTPSAVLPPAVGVSGACSVPTAQLPSVPTAQAAEVAAGGQAEAETSDYNLRRLERRIKNLQSTVTMLTQMGEDTTAIEEDIMVQQQAVAARREELQAQDLRRTMTSDSLGGVSPPPPVDEHAEFQRLRREELQRLDARIKENSATLELLRHEAGYGNRLDRLEKELAMDQIQRDKYQRLIDDAEAEAAAAASDIEPEPEAAAAAEPAGDIGQMQDTGMLISCGEIKVKRQVGVGAFKDVHEGEWQGGPVAVLKLRHPDDARQRHEFMMEAAVFVQLGDHPNLLRYFGRCEPEPSAGEGEGFHAFVTELARHCSLDDFLEQVHTRPDRYNGEMPATLKRDAAAQIASGMAHMHARGLIHRDLAARNVLVAEYDKPGATIAVQLTDYGLCRSVASTSRYLTEYNASNDNETVPKLWIPPESLMKQLYSRASDVWAFGITLWEIVTNGRLPYDTWACGDDELVRRVVMGEMMTVPEGCPANLYDVMRRCWTYKAQRRPKFTDLESELRILEL